MQEMIRTSIAICDDESVMREQITRLLIKLAPGCQLTEFTSGEELLSSGLHFDIVFLDIQMEGINGINAARTLRAREENTILIFVTAIREYVFEAFDLSAFHYLLKPFSEKKFEEVFRWAQDVLAADRREARRALLFKVKDRVIKVSRRQICYVEARGKKLAVHTTRDILEINEDMKDLEKELGEQFYRCHRGYLVNLAHIEEYDNNSIAMSNGDRVFLSRRKYNEFTQIYLQYLRKGGGRYGVDASAH